jgi:hypothetical protein
LSEYGKGAQTSLFFLSFFLSLFIYLSISFFLYFFLSILLSFSGLCMSERSHNATTYIVTYVVTYIAIYIVTYIVTYIATYNSTYFAAVTENKPHVKGRDIALQIVVKIKSFISRSVKHFFVQLMQTA